MSWSDPCSYCSESRANCKCNHWGETKVGDSVHLYSCRDCKCSINAGEFVTFGVCDDCFDKCYEKYKPAIHEKLVAFLAKAEVEETQEDLWNEIGAYIHSAPTFKFYKHFMEHMLSNYTVKRK